MRARLLLLLLNLCKVLGGTAAGTAAAPDERPCHPEDFAITVVIQFLQTCTANCPCAMRAIVHGMLQGADYTFVLEVQQGALSGGLHTIRISILDAHPEISRGESLLTAATRYLEVHERQHTDGGLPDPSLPSPPASQEACNVEAQIDMIDAGDTGVGDGLGSNLGWQHQHRESNGVENGQTHLISGGAAHAEDTQGSGLQDSSASVAIFLCFREGDRNVAQESLIQGQE